MTREEVEAGKSAKGGFIRKQLAVWGVPWPPSKGWRWKLEHTNTIPVPIVVEPKKKKRPLPNQVGWIEPIDG